MAIAPHQRVMKQERLKDSPPDNYNPDKTIRRLLNYDIDHTTGRLKFWYEQDGADNTVPTMDELNLDVYGDTEFYLRLSDQRDWYWSKAFDAITTKKDKTRYYGRIQYENNGVFEDWDGNAPKNYACKRIRFLASLNEDAGTESIHEFSMNIDLILPGGRILPISLDPDIQNPKTFAPAPIGQPAPGLLSALSR